MEVFNGGILAYAKIKNWTQERRSATFIFKPTNATRNKYEFYPLRVNVDNILTLCKDDIFLFPQNDIGVGSADIDSFKRFIEDYYQCQVIKRGVMRPAAVSKNSYIDKSILLYKFSTVELMGINYRRCVNNSLYPYVRFATYDNDKEHVKASAMTFLKKMAKVGILRQIKPCKD